MLADISSSARSGETAHDPSPLDHEAPLPFENLLLPAVSVARTMLCSRLDLSADTLSFPAFGVISAGAYRQLERDLLRRLSTIAGEALQEEFRRFRPLGRSLSAALDLPEVDPPEDTEYRRFVNQHLRDGWGALVEEYPVLGRLLAVAVALWAESTAELLLRLAADSDELARTFELEGGPPQVTGFDLALGDPHNGGRSVAAVEFADGRKVVYKPRPLAPEAAFNHLLEWCNRNGASPELKVTTLLDRGDYGWVERLEPLPCADDRAAERFYRRAGMLLCLLHLVRATDCHFENLIAHGEHPVLIDAETVLHPDPQPLEFADGSELGETVGDRLLRSTVLRTGLLPGWQGGGDEPVTDRSALGRLASEQASRDDIRWARINTDDMEVRPERGVVEVAANVARIGARALSPLDHATQLTEGFASMYRLLMADREALCAGDGPLAAMRALRVRVIYRPTRVYAALTAAGRRPEALRSGLEYGIHLERLARAFLVAKDKPVSWPVLGAEIRAMEQMDVPLLTAPTDAAHLELDDGTEVRDAFAAPSHDAMQELVAAMSESDLERQLLVVRASLQAKAARAPSGTDGQVPPDLPASSPISSADLLEAAAAIGHEIERHALPDGRDAVNWIGLRYMEDWDRYRLDALGDSLYDGCCGVALFLAALSRATGEARFATLSLRSVHLLRRTLRGTDPGSRHVVAGAHGLGGVTGLGSFIYSLVGISELLEDDALIDDAVELAQWLTPELIAADDKLDVMSGAAGALLGLLALHSATGLPEALEAATACGECLLRSRVEVGGHRAWRTVTEQPLTGFSHGAAGISYALARLHEVTGDRDHLEAAVEGIEYERSLFSERDGNWPDLRPSADGNRFPVKWCHGAAGIALARLGCRRSAAVPHLDREIAAGLRTTRESYLQDADFLCCGNLGRAETFLVAGEVTGDTAWRRLAATGAASVVTRAAETGGYRVWGAGAYNPGFFHGAAGIGYQLLRLREPELPSVLLME